MARSSRRAWTQQPARARIAAVAARSIHHQHLRIHRHDVKLGITGAAKAFAPLSATYTWQPRDEHRSGDILVGQVVFSSNTRTAFNSPAHDVHHLPPGAGARLGTGGVQAHGNQNSAPGRAYCARRSAPPLF